MEQIKFRAFIDGNMMDWDLKDMCGPHLFSMRAIICPWLLAGNVPDMLTGIKDDKGLEIYEGDILNFDVFEGAKGVEHPAWNQYGDARITPNGVSFGDWRSSYCFNARIVGNVHEDPELLEANQ